MLYNKERPQRWDDMIGQEAVVKSLKKQSRTGKFFQVYVLAGQFGSGKTTAARIIAKAANCKHKDSEGNPCCQCENCRSITDGVAMDVIEMDAASNTGVDSIRDLKETVNYRPVSLDKKVYIIDEVHMLSTGAFNALLKVLEEPPEDVIFILCTTELKKIPATVRSRAACYQFSQIVRKDMVPYLKEVAQKHNYAADDEALELIARNSDGAMRNALSLLEQATQLGDVTKETVAEMIGVSDPVYLFSLLDALLRRDVSRAVCIVNDLLSGGKNAYLMVNDLLQLCADCVLALNAGADAVEASEEEVTEIQKLILKVADLTAYCNLSNGLMDMRNELRQCPDRTTLICGIMKMNAQKGMGEPVASEPASSPVISQQIAEMKQEIALLKEQIKKGSFAAEEMKEKSDEAQTDTQEWEDVSENDAFPSELSVQDEDKEADADKELEEQADTEVSGMQEAQDAADSFGFGALSAFLDLFGGESGKNSEDAAETSEQEESGSMEEKAVSESTEDEPAESSIGDTEKYIAELCASQRVIAAMIESDFTKSYEDGTIVFTTNHEPVFRLMQTREKALEPETGFPFLYRLA